MRSFTLQCTALTGTNKVGKLKPDEDGYYPVVLGGFDIPNPRGDTYPFESAKNLFTESSVLMRNVSNGTQYGEWGHPKRQPGQTLSNYIKRCSIVDETNIAFHIKKLDINETDVKDDNGNVVVSIIGWVKGCGPKAEEFDKMMANPNINVCFSIRATTEDVPNGRGALTRHISSIITWDLVVYPGLRIAQKYKVPALESFEAVSFTDDDLMEVKRDINKRGQFAMEDETCLAYVNETLGSRVQRRPSLDRGMLQRRTTASKWL